MPDITLALRPTEARALIRAILDDGIVLIDPNHCVPRMEERGFTDVDVHNILRAGVVRDPEWENGEWRYRIETPRMGIVIAFEAEDSLVVITVLRFDKR